MSVEQYLHLSFDLREAAEFTVKLLIAYALAVPIGYNREKESRSAGIRTFPLVAVGACAYMLIGIEAMHGDDAHSRVIYGIVTGIGFIGGGAILKSGGNVSGTATAASIWNMGAIGVAVAFGRIELGVLLSILNVFTHYFGERLKVKLGKQESPSGPQDHPNSKENV